MKQLGTYLTQHKPLYDSQYGFRAGHSTELASIGVIDRITHDLDKSKIPISIFSDLSKAFDTLDHIILLKKKSLWYHYDFSRINCLIICNNFSIILASI